MLTQRSRCPLCPPGIWQRTCQQTTPISRPYDCKGALTERGPSPGWGGEPVGYPLPRETALLSNKGLRYWPKGHTMDIGWQTLPPKLRAQFDLCYGIKMNYIHILIIDPGHRANVMRAPPGDQASGPHNEAGEVCYCSQGPHKG